MLGLSVACQRRLIVTSVCINRLYQINLGKLGYNLARTAKKYALNVRIALSATFLLCKFGGTSW